MCQSSTESCLIPPPWEGQVMGCLTRPWQSTLWSQLSNKLVFVRLKKKKPSGSTMSCNLRLTSKASLPNLKLVIELFYCVCWDGAFWSMSCKICNVIRGAFRIISVFGLKCYYYSVLFFSIYRQYCKNLLISKFKLNYFNCNRQMNERLHNALQCYSK